MSVFELSMWATVAALFISVLFLLGMLMAGSEVDVPEVDIPINWDETTSHGEFVAPKYKEKQLCVIDTETTGLYAGTHELIELCIIPVDDKLNRIGYPFHVQIKALFPERAHPKALKINGLDPTEGVSAQAARELLTKQMDDAGIKKFIPIAQNWEFDRSFLKEFLGRNFEKRFHYRAEDTQRLAAGINRAHIIATGTPLFKSTSLKNLANTFCIDYSGAHRAERDCEITLDVYRKLCSFIRA